MDFRSLAFAGITIAGAALAACGGGDSSPTEVDVRVTDSAIQMPSDLKAGFTRFAIDGQSDGDNHLLFVRANEGVTIERMKEVAKANDGSGDSLATIVGGNGGMPKGSKANVTFELKPGNYGVMLFTEDGDLAADSYFTVNGSAKTSKPKAKGVIEMGPGLVFSVPPGIGNKGTFEVVNKDAQPHEAAFVQLADGKSIEDARKWATGGFEGPPPFSSAGGFGALDGGERGWIESDLKPGEYAIICWIPDANGPHWINGMSASFTVK